MKNHYDVAIIGSGFSGSILAWILAARGRSVALIDPATHPRFAIGESSTPIADLLLRRLGQRYGLPELQTMSTYGTWQDFHPDIACGRKRGFSYYFHQRNQDFTESESHENSLMVAASASDELADTHWYRRDVDRFLFDKAIAAGATDLSGHRVGGISIGQPHRLQVSDHVPIISDWIIDASGQAGVTARLTKRRSLTDQLKTNTRSRYAHYRGVGSWREILVEHGLESEDSPFNTDDAAQHHLLGDHWLWLLRFNNGITSVGWSGSDPANLRGTFPSVDRMLADAELVEPSGGPLVTDRLQRLFHPVIAERCVMLPSTACTIDPLHSTGIAQSLSGVVRLAEIIIGGDECGSLAEYGGAVLDEAKQLDLLVSTAYQTMHDFNKFTVACSLYFVLAIMTEEMILDGLIPSRFWGADQPIGNLVRDWSSRLIEGEADEVARSIRGEIAPWNHSGLLDPAARNRYAYTATKA